ncbi:hypothetical protein ACIA5C_25465 [Actinoplanes sp. NPDC051343]|uniref:hypothetical protein n=1 Tax=Actinoplanes sp. NPDC051343 TaxID=3363906 RepID=UPI0037915199
MTANSFCHYPVPGQDRAQEARDKLMAPITAANASAGNGTRRIPTEPALPPRPRRQDAPAGACGRLPRAGHESGRDLDLVVEAEDGTLVASALGWLDEVTGSDCWNRSVSARATPAAG